MPYYPMCDHTVTVYRLTDGQVQRQVIENCCYLWQTRRTRDTAGTRQSTSFLLILPGCDRQILPGDRIYDGIGPDVSAAQWPGFVPGVITGLSEVGCIKAYYRNRQICHIEASNA